MSHLTFGLRARSLLCATVAMALPALAQNQGLLAAPHLEVNLLAGHWSAVARQVEALPQPVPPALRALLAHAELATNRANEAICAFAALSDPDFLESWQRWADELAQRHPRAAVAHYLRGDAAARREDWAQARSAFDKALELDPRLALALNARALTRAALGQWLEARSDLTKAAALDPEFIDTTVNLGVLTVLERQEPEVARQRFDATLKHRADHVVAMVGMGAVAAQQGQWRTADDEFARASKAAPCIPLGGLSRLLAQQAELDQMQRLAEALKQDPTVGTAVMREVDSALSSVRSSDRQTVLDALTSTRQSDAKAAGLQNALDSLRALRGASQVGSKLAEAAAGVALGSAAVAPNVPSVAAAAGFAVASVGMDRIAAAANDPIGRVRDKLSAAQATGTAGWTFSAYDRSPTAPPSRTGSSPPPCLPPCGGPPGGLYSRPADGAWDRAAWPVVLWPVLLYTVRAASYTAATEE